ncbi:oxidoreductase [Kitasatospora sp. MMS16-BH015]|uniref:FMN reductase n=1 Tax=Kitasatospora sp. MMS16-BH015 TaxID=2018025 RepID=UPI000CA0A89A|nr:FMN reductase [Kitasatospora sp. MMS16-BH015]AUG78384.1 oxidoreductase [Kitasatospora sp. MMS16-BH015]
MPKLVVISAGLSQPSSTRLLADQLAAETDRLLPSEIHTVELRDVAGDITNNLLTGYPSPKLRAEIEAVTAADALIAVTPVFSASYSGLFKSFFDVLDVGVLTDKPVLMGATGGSARHSLALEYALRPLFAYLRARVVPTAVFAASEDWGAGGGNGGLASRITRAAGELAELLGSRPERSAPVEELIPFEQQLAALRAPQR